MLALHFKFKVDQLFVQRASSKVTIDFKLADIKLESSEAYLLKLEKNLSLGFEIIDIFFKKCGFITYADTSNVSMPTR